MKVSLTVSPRVASGLLRGLDLEKGALVKARVSKVFNPYEVLVKIGPEEIQARTTVPLREGQVLLLKAVHHGQTLRLQVVSSGTSDVTKGVLEALRDIFNRIKTPQGKDFFVEIERLNGQSLKKALTEDIKDLFQRIEDKTKEPSERDISSETKLLTDKIGLLQETALRQGFFVLPLPLLWEDLKEGLLYWRSAGRTDAQKETTVVLKLDLRQYGNIMVLLGLGGEGLSVRLYVEDRKFYSVLKTQAHILEQSLQAQGIRIKALEFYHKDRLDGKALGLIDHKI
jgi:hypothetical protein